VTRNAGGPRAIKLADAKNGRITPEQAEKWARDHSLEPFARNAVLPSDEVMALAKWTAPMAAAWFIWRSPDAVRDQWDKARQGWTIWERLPGRRMPNRRGRWRLKRIGPATLADVFCRAGFAKEIARSSRIDRGVALGARSMSEGDNPYDRMRLVLERGWLLATRRATGDEDAEEEAIPPDEWKRLFRRLTDIPESSAPSGEPESRAAPRELLEEEGQILFLREQVIAAETRICREEFEWRRWTMAQIAGWFAYDNENNFRSLGEEDFVGRTYHGSIYTRDFEIGDIELRIQDLLFCSGILGYQDRKEVGRSDFTGVNKVWELSDTVFVREDIFSNKFANQLRKQKFPSGNKPSANEGLAPSPAGRVGRSLKIRKGIADEMIEKVVTNKMTEVELRTATGESLVSDFGHAQGTVKAARKMALQQLPEIIRNSISNE